MTNTPPCWPPERVGHRKCRSQIRRRQKNNRNRFRDHGNRHSARLGELDARRPNCPRGGGLLSPPHHLARSEQESTTALKSGTIVIATASARRRWCTSTRTIGGLGATAGSSSREPRCWRPALSYQARNCFARQTMTTSHHLMDPKLCFSRNWNCALAIALSQLRRHSTGPPCAVIQPSCRR